MPGERTFHLDHDAGFRAACQVISSLAAAGYQAYLVGGCVRDMLLGKVPADYDVTTNALPDEVQAHFPKTVPTGIKHGTVSVQQNGLRVEVTTFRREGGYADGRHPDAVEYVSSLDIDLSRRDFTVNAMAMDQNGKVIDPFGGQADLRDRIIRAVGDPAVRFGEDALRILRAIRFAVQLEARIAPETWEAVKRLGSRMALISKERIRDEWNKILLTDVRTGVDQLAAASLLGYIFEGTEAPSEKWTHAAEIASAMPADLALRQAALFHSLQLSSNSAQGLLRKLKQPNGLIREAISLLSAIPDDDPLTWTSSHWKSYLFQHGRRAAEGAVRIASLRSSKAAVGAEGRVLAIFEQAARQQPIWSLEELAIDGHDLQKELCVAEGPVIGWVLTQLAEDILLRSISNERQMLLERAKDLVSRAEFNSK